ncbi:MAG: plasmid pRiA4b ORF-3 family protein, partial [Bacillota bacterium]
YVAQPALCRLGESVDHRVLVDVKGFEDLDDSLATNDDQPGLPAEVLRRSKKGQGTRRRAGYGQTSGRRWAPPASRQVVRFKVELRHYGVYRVIDVPGDGTLHDLHGAIQQAFGWDDDHLYAFFMDRKGWRSKDRYESPYSDRSPSASAAVIEELKLRTGKKIEYLFDFGDEWWHDVEVVGRFPRVAGVRYPRVVEAVGDPPPQYGDLAVE